jgi:hypothetical protein
MKIEICNHLFEGREYFEFTLHDGPENVERAHGYSVDLIEAFTKIIEWRERIAQDYGSLPSISEGYDVPKGDTPDTKPTENSETD